MSNECDDAYSEMEGDSSLHMQIGDDIKTRIMRSRLFYFRKIIATQVTETYREFQDRHKMCHTVKTFRNFGQQRERLTHYLTPLKLLSPPYQRICPPWHPSLVGGILFFVVARIDLSPGQSLLSPIPSWEWEKFPQSANDLPHCHSPVLASYPSRKMMCHSQAIVCSKLVIIEM